MSSRSHIVAAIHSTAIPSIRSTISLQNIFGYRRAVFRHGGETAAVANVLELFPIVGQ
jgi:hypothetical protein